MVNRVYQIVSDVMGIPIEMINDEASPDSISSWDSMAHLNLILAIETEFNISLSPEEGLEMMSVKLIRLTLQGHGIDS